LALKIKLRFLAVGMKNLGWHILKVFGGCIYLVETREDLCNVMIAFRKFYCRGKIIEIWLDFINFLTNLRN
jgi:hypothetical protein